MKLNIVAATTVILLILAMYPASATSFIVDCQYDDYRSEQADYVFTGVVSDVDFNFKDTEITFQVTDVEKGDINETLVLYQYGNIQTGNHQIPSITLDWTVGETYRVQASDQHDLETDEKTIQLVCGEMGRQIQKADQQMCAQVITHAKDPQTGDIHQYPTPCDVPEGFEVVDEPRQADAGEVVQGGLWKILAWFENLF